MVSVPQEEAADERAFSPLSALASKSVKVWFSSLVSLSSPLLYNSS